MLAFGVSHDGVNGDLVARLAGDRLDGVPDRVEIPAAADVEPVEQLAAFVGDGSIVRPLSMHCRLGDERVPKFSGSWAPAAG